MAKYQGMAKNANMATPSTMQNQKGKGAVKGGKPAKGVGKTGKPAGKDGSPLARQQSVASIKHGGTAASMK